MERKSLRKRKPVLCDRCALFVDKKDRIEEDGLIYHKHCFTTMLERE